MLLYVPGQALAELYVINGQYGEAFSLYADVGGFNALFLCLDIYQINLISQ